MTNTIHSVQGRSGNSDVWVAPTWDGKPDLGPWLLPDRRDITDVIAAGDAASLPMPIRFDQVSSGQRWGDLLWTTGLPSKVASARFVEVLTSIGATGWRTYDVPVLDRTGRPINGYVGFATTGGDDALDVSHLYGHQKFAFRVRAHVLEALLAAGVDQFDHEVVAPE